MLNIQICNKRFLLELILNAVSIDFLYLMTKFLDYAKIGIAMNDSNNLQEIKVSIIFLGNKKSIS